MRLEIPYIVSLRGSDVPFYNPRFHWLDRLFFCRLSRKIWKNAKRVIANSEGLRVLALKNAPDQAIDIIPNGIDTNQFRPSFTQSNVLRVLCIARLIQRKGIDTLIKAIAQLPKDQIRLKIVGKGNQESELKRLASSLDLASNVEFMEYIPHEKIAEVYQKSDIFVLPSLNEGMSNAVLEAMACGLSIVTTDTGGTAELIKNNGTIVPKNDALSIANALRKYLNSKPLISKQGQQSRELALKMSWQNTAKAYYDAYQTAAS
jgi:glycosyltransferase involved in cell wall biosynthesis